MGLLKSNLKYLIRVLKTNQTKFFSSSDVNFNFKLLEVGKLSEPKLENYQTGQLFLHKLFGYRGVLLFPWTACVFDKSDDSLASSDESSYDKLAADELDKNKPLERTKAKKLTYYQVLIDSRDIPYVRSMPESVTFLSGSVSNRSVYSIHGLDYVSQNDVLPYSSIEKTPIYHDLFDKFLLHDANSKTNLVPRESLKTWQESNHPWLELSDVFIGVTNNIKVTVIPFYIGVKEEQRKKLYWWRYSIRIENLSNIPVILRERHWRIFSQAGTFETVRGKGVVGQEPLLNREYSAFQYSSHVNLQSPSGHMWGTFKMEKEDGTFFDVRIPSFYLDSKEQN